MTDVALSFMFKHDKLACLKKIENPILERSWNVLKENRWWKDIVTILIKKSSTRQQTQTYAGHFFVMSGLSLNLSIKITIFPFVFVFLFFTVLFQCQSLESLSLYFARVWHWDHISTARDRTYSPQSKWVPHTEWDYAHLFAACYVWGCCCCWCEGEEGEEPWHSDSSVFLSSHHDPLPLHCSATSYWRCRDPILRSQHI